MRNHNERFDRYECGEGNTCSWIGNVLGAVIGGGLGLLDQKSTNDAEERAADKNAEAMKPQFYGPGVAYGGKILGDASSIYGNSGFAPKTNPLQLLGRHNQLGYAENMLPGMIGAAQQSWMQGLNPGLDPYVGAMIEAGQNDLTQEFQRNVMPYIADQSQSTGGYGGSRQGVAQGIAAEGLLEAQGDLEARLLSDAYGRSLQHQQAAWNQAPHMTGLGLMPSQLQQEIGGQYKQDALRQAQNLQGYQQAVQPWYAFSQGGNPGNPGYTAGGSMLTAGLGGAFAGAGIGGELGGWLNNAMQPTFNPVPVVNNPVPGDAYMPSAGYSRGGFGF